jgi:hypothetical protein
MAPSISCPSHRDSPLRPRMPRTLLAAASFAFFFAVLCRPALATVDHVPIDESRRIGHYLEAKGSWRAPRWAGATPSP